MSISKILLACGLAIGSLSLATAPAAFVQHLEVLWSALRDQPITM